MNPLKRYSCEEALCHPWLAMEMMSTQCGSESISADQINAIDTNIDDAPKLTALDDAMVACTNESTRCHEMAPQSIVIQTSESDICNCNKTSDGMNVMTGNINAPKQRSNTLGNPNVRTSAMLSGKLMAVDPHITPIPMGLLAIAKRTLRRR